MSIQQRKQLMVMVMCSLIAGALFYYFFCPDVYFVIFIDRVTGLNTHVPSNISGQLFICIMRSYLLDFLWSYTFASVIYLIAYNESYWRWLTISIPTTLGIILEILQKFKLIGGTFDTVDIIIEMVGAVLAFIMICLKVGGNNEKD